MDGRGGYSWNEVLRWGGLSNSLHAKAAVSAAWDDNDRAEERERGRDEVKGVMEREMMRSTCLFTSIVHMCGTEEILMEEWQCKNRSSVIDVNLVA